MDAFSQSRRQMGEKIEQLLHQHSPTPILKTEITYQPTPWLEGGILWRIRDIGWDQCAVMFMLGHLPSRIMVRLDGSSQPIHQFNQRVSLQIKKKSHALSYAKFFGDFVHGEAGAFRIVEDTFDLLTCETRGQAISEKYGELLGKTKIKSCKKGWKLKTNVLYGATLFKAKFQIHPGGMLEMLDDKLLADGIPASSLLKLI